MRHTSIYLRASRRSRVFRVYVCSHLVCAERTLRSVGVEPGSVRGFDAKRTKKANMETGQFFSISRQLLMLKSVPLVCYRASLFDVQTILCIQLFGLVVAVDRFAISVCAVAALLCIRPNLALAVSVPPLVRSLAPSLRCLCVSPLRSLLPPKCRAYSLLSFAVARHSTRFGRRAPHHTIPEDDQPILRASYDGDSVSVVQLIVGARCVVNC